MSEAVIDNNQENDVNKNCGDEDVDLDSFFKKKDKKGKKKKSKKTETGVIDKAIIKPKKKESEPKKDSENLKEDGNFKKDVEEWIDFEDESQRDYSDLKIQNMQIAAGANQNAEPEYDAAGVLIVPKPVEGPWKPMSSQKSTTSTAAPEKKKVQPEAPKKTGAYRPPQARAGASSLQPSALPKKNRRQQMPQINNEFDFPSLGQVVKDPTIPPKGFEMVKHGNKTGTWQTQQQQNARASEIKLDNQYSALNPDN